MRKPVRHLLKKAIFSLFFFSCVLLFTKAVFYTKWSNPDDSLLPPTTTEIPLLPPVPIKTPTYSHFSAKPCTHRQPTVLAIVHSSPSHILHRKAIRLSWGTASYPKLITRTVFIVGRSTLPKIQSRVELEAVEHGDIVAVDMLDSYNNLTYKHLAGLNWALKNCPGASYVLKVDDDVIVDVKRAVKILESANLSNDVIACRVVAQGTTPRRSGKWMVSRFDYPMTEYPEYCSGLAYFVRPGALKKVYDVAVSGKVGYLWIDDVFVTGLAAQMAGVRRMDLGVWYSKTERDVVKWLESKDSKHAFPWMVAEMTPGHWPVDAIKIWNKFETLGKNVSK